MVRLLTSKRIVVMDRVQETGCLEASPGELPAWKRWLDVACVVIALPVLLPLFALVGLGIRISSPGPVIFRQERIGYRGKRFVCFKFRTMKAGSDVGIHKQYLDHLINSDVPMTKMDSQGDARLVPMGRFLRATGLDELPQIINVLRGEMSLVGPRPCIPYEYEQYLPWQKQRFNAMPGLTGLWQVSGKNKTTFNQMIYLDIAYAQNMSFWLDVVVMLKTIPALARQAREMRAQKNSATKQSRS